MHTKILLALIALAPSLAPAPTAGGAPPSDVAIEPDLNGQMRAASEKIMPVREKAETMSVQGHLSEANAMLAATFPAATRTPIECLIVGNVLFKQDHQAAYELHKTAAAALPTYANAQLEWAIDQHRAKEYAGALDSYMAFSKLSPSYAPAYGLAAECALRLNRVDEAIALWTESENASSGTVETFESLVCDVSGLPAIDRERERLLPDVRDKKDALAAADLLLKDLTMAVDWWNVGAGAERVRHDLALAKKCKADDGWRLEAAILAAECELDAQRGARRTATRLKASKFMVGPAHNIPKDGRAASLLLSAALSSGVLDREAARTALGPKLFAAAKESGDAEMFNAAANLYMPESKDQPDAGDKPAHDPHAEMLNQIDRAGWEQTKDARFAGSLLVSLSLAGDLAPDHPDLVRALKDFPSDSTIASVALRAAWKAGKSDEGLLINAILAEYTRFSASGLFMLRPSAVPLRVLFDRLAKDRAAMKK